MGEYVFPLEEILQKKNLYISSLFWFADAIYFSESETDSDKSVSLSIFVVNSISMTIHKRTGSKQPKKLMRNAYIYKQLLFIMLTKCQKHSGFYIALSKKLARSIEK